MKQAEAILARTEQTAQKMGRQIASALNSSSPAVQKAGARLQELNAQIQAQRQALQNAQVSANGYKAKIDALRASEDAQNAAIEQTKAKIAELKAKYRELAEASKLPSNTPGGAIAIRAQMDQLKASIASATGTLSEQQNALGGIQSSLATASGEFGSASSLVGLLTEELSETTSAAEKASLALKFTGVGAAVGKVGSALKTVLYHVSGLSAVKKIADHFKSGASAGNSLSGVAKKLGGSIFSLGNMIKAKLINTALNAVFNSMGAAMKSLAGHSQSVNNALSKLGQGAKQIGASLVGAFSPILSAIQPILTKLVSMVTEAINAVNQFFAKLTGASSWKKAVVALQSYAGAAEGAGGAANDAAGAAEKLKRSVMGFDQLNKLDDMSSSGSGGGSGGGGGGGGGGAGDGITWVDMPIGNEIAKFAEMFKQAWENADFYDIGRIVGEKLRDALDSIPWETIKDTCNKVAKSVATFLNGFFETPGLFEAIGRTIGESINTVLGTVHTFLDTLHFDSIGKAITTSLQAAFNTLDWSLVGKVVSDIPKKVLDFLRGSIEGINWSEVPTDIINAIKEFFEGYDVKGIAQSMKNLLVAAWDAAVDLFKATGKLLLDVGVNLVGKGWNSIKEWAVDKAVTITAKVKDAADSVRVAIANWVKNVNGKIYSFKAKVADAAGSLRAQVTTFVNNIRAKTYSFKAKVTDAAGSLRAQITTFVNNIKAKVISFQAKVTDAAGSLRAQITTFVNNIRAKVISFQAKVTDAAGSVRKYITDWISGVKGKIVSIPAKVTDAADTLRQKISDWINDVKDKVVEIKAKIVDLITTVFDNWFKSTDGSELELKLKHKLTEAFQSFVDWLKSPIEIKLQPIIEWLNGDDQKTFNGMQEYKGMYVDEYGNLHKPEEYQITAPTPVNGGNQQTTMTGVITAVEDKIPTDQKKFKGFTSLIESFKDSLKSKLINGMKANIVSRVMGSKFPYLINSMKANITSKVMGSKFGYTIGSMIASIGSKSMSGSFSYTIGGMIASLSSFRDNIPSWIKTIGGFIASIFGIKAGANGGVYKGLGGAYDNGWRPIQGFATGGTPYGGQVFLAREAGPELVGTLGSHTAVMNNDQIVSSVASGVRSAVVDALMSMGGNSGDVVLYIDSTELARASLKGQRSLDRMMNPRVVFGG